MNIAIVGFDTEGRSTYTFLAKQGHNITICDKNDQITIPDGAAARLGDNYLDNLDQFDLIVRTAGMHPAKILADNPTVADKITSHINLFMQYSPTRNIIGITGTKGKGTTSTLTAKMLEAAGKDVRLGGNIGIPPLDFIDKLNEQSWVVLELSSFQLIDLKQSPHIATCLMIVPEHLNWHEDFEEYVAAKQQLFIHQNSDDVAIYYADNEDSESVAAASEGMLIPYYDKPGAVIENGSITIDGHLVCSTNDLQLLGKHNWQNACAAVTTAWQVTQDITAIRSALTTFTGLPHRLELVRELHGVSYYDDSFGTTPETAVVAIEAFAAPKIVILGGSDKGANFDELVNVVTKSNVKCVITIGDTGPTIAAGLRARAYENIIEDNTTMQDIVSTATAQAAAGDVVLLSTGCASFGLFKDYKDRGDQFKQAVLALA